MKPFFDQTETIEASASHEYVSVARNDSVSTIPPTGSHTYTGRIAVYDALTAAPRIKEVAESSADGFIEVLAAQVYHEVRDMNGSLPYTVLREAVENFIHAQFREPVISILDSGNTVRFSDQGPGITQKEQALLPGYTTATSAMKQIIRGVGSGLPLIREFLAFEGGSLSIEDNLGCGTVVTLKNQQASTTPREQRSAAAVPSLEPQLPVIPKLSTRHKKVLSLVMEFGEAGPTLVSKELGVGLSTAYRDLAHLEETGLIVSDEFGKRVVSELGTTYLDSMFS